MHRLMGTRYSFRWSKIWARPTFSNTLNEYSIAQITQAARTLEQNGARLIVGACGYFIKFQEHVKDAVNVPVALSSLLQIPMIISNLSGQQSLGVVTAVEGQVDEAMLLSSGAASTDRIVVAAIEQRGNFFDCGLGRCRLCSFPTNWKRMCWPR